jgi:hypothetical protein
MEAYGAEGGGRRLSGNSNAGLGGLGGYAYGTLLLPGSATFYLYLGNYGSWSANGNAAGGFNGGGQGYASSSGEPGNGGGGATDIRVTAGSWNNATSLRSRIMVAGGGGGGGEDTGDPYGHGGGFTTVMTSGYTNYNASQTAAGTGGGFGYGGGTNRGDGGGGGGGYYGGGTTSTTSVGSDTQGGGGGTGFVSGLSGCNAVNASGVHTGTPNHFSNYVFVNGGMQNGVNYGQGYVRISKE